METEQKGSVLFIEEIKPTKLRFLDNQEFDHFTSSSLENLREIIHASLGIGGLTEKQLSQLFSTMAALSLGKF